MLLRSWLADWLPTSFWRLSFFRVHRTARKRPRDVQIHAEGLEGRCLLTLTISLANPGSEALIFYGEQANDQSGGSVSGVGDVNGDGFDDFIVGAKLAETVSDTTVNTGEAYLVFGRSSLASTNLSNLGTGGVAIVGIDAFDGAGFSVSDAGDFNGDGFADLLVSTPFAAATANAKPSAGETYLVFGRSTFAASINLASLGTGGLTIVGADAGDLSGVKVAGGGDVNGDGYDDIIIGATQADGLGNSNTGAGECYVVFGKPSPSSVVDLATLGSAGIQIVGANAGDGLGYGASIAGDLNGDGIDDIAVSAVFASVPGESKIGKTYVLFGSTSPQVMIDLSNSASIGVTISGADAFDYSGRSVMIAGDVNGDGFADLLVGAPGADGPNNGRQQAGDSYIVFGKASLPSSINLDSLGPAGVVIQGAAAADFNGRTGAGVGDVNGDGYDDLFLRGEDAARQHKGKGFVVFGSASLSATIDLAVTDAAGVEVIGIDPDDYSGFQVAGAGDINGDGFDDLLSGTPAANGANNSAADAGETYLIWGANFTSSVTRLGSSNGDRLTGTSGANIMNGATGDDTLVGLGGADVIYGGNGNDLLAVSSTDFRRLNGGNGTDTLRLDGSGLTLDLTTLSDTKIENIEIIDIWGSGPNSLILDLTEVLNITANSNSEHTANTLTVRRDTDDTVNIGPGWDVGQSVTEEGVLYRVFTQGAATLRVEDPSKVIELSRLGLGNRGVSIPGIDSDDETGQEVTSVGDMNGDGFDDVAIGAFFADAEGNNTFNAGECYVIFGGPSMPATINLSNLGSSGFTIFGNGVFNGFGRSVGRAGDVNGDGFDDLIVGEVGGDGFDNSAEGAGNSYIIFGGASLPSLIRLSNLGSLGITLFGVDPFDASGGAVSGAGDMNGDGFDDVIIAGNGGGGPANDEPYAGEAYVVFGNANLPSTISLADLGTGGMAIFGADAEDLTGASVSNAGDVNGDGFDDIFIGGRAGDGPTNSKDNSGEGYLIFGGSSLPASIDLADLGTRGVTIFGVDDHDYAGWFVDGVGDINGDNLDDIIIGAYGADGIDESREDAGESYVIFGQVNFPSTIELANLGTAGIRFLGVDAFDYSGLAVSGAGDFNGDGFDDLLIGAIGGDGLVNAPSDVGECYLIFGRASMPTSIDLGDYGAVGLTIFGTNFRDRMGVSLASAGDVNGDGFSDLLLGVPGYRQPTAPFKITGAAYIIFGGEVSGPLQFISSATYAVPENSTEVGTTVAIDADFPGQSISYVISGGDDQAKFSITNGGVLTFIAPSDFENPTDTGTNNVYNVQVTASDENGQTAIQDIAVSVTPLNDNSPVFASSAAFNVAENSTTVSTVNAIDADQPLQTISFSISGGADQARFSITSGGVLTFVSAPDFENPTDVGANNVYNVQITGNDGYGGLATQNIAVTVTAANDNSPVLTSPATFNVPENSTTVGTVTATDADLPAQTLSYSISGGSDQARFSITSGGVLTFVAVPDFESPTDVGANNVYNVQVTANDGNGRLTTQNIAVTVTAVNDNSPVFTSPATFNVPENSTLVGTVLATDADLPTQTLSYTLSGGADQHLFSITPGGVLTFVSPRDFENPTDSNADNGYQLQITASDGLGRAGLQNIVVTITPVNDFIPAFTSAITFNVAENSAAVGMVTAIDGDLPTQSISYSITGGADQGRFSITSEGVLQFKVAPDFENPADDNSDNIYELQVTASDGLGGSSVQVLTIQVTPTNDPPVFNSTNLSVNENAATVGTIQVTDSDLPSQTVTLTIIGGPDQARFVLNGNVLSFSTAPDFESPTDAGADNVYNLQITASDGVGGLTTQNIAVTVLPINESAPVFTSALSFQVGENTATVGTLTATDSDLPVPSLTFQIVGGTDLAKFSLSPGGLLRFIAPPDFENPADAGLNNIYEVQVEVSDGEGGVQSETIAVTVMPVNDNAPVWTSSATFDVIENSTNVGTLVTTDADLPAQTISYIISGGSDQARFTISGSVLQFMAGPDFENPGDIGSDNVYNVQVAASDGNGQSTVQNITVTVVPANDHLPEFSSPVAFIVAENSVNVGTVLATDADEPVQSLRFSITGGLDAAKFSITSAGVLTFVASPDFEHATDVGANNVYNLEITAGDGEGGLTTQAISVTVTPTNDSLPVFTSPAIFNVAENSTAVGTVGATDADLPSQTISYSITGGVDRSRFAVTSGGVLTFLVAPDFENPGDAGLNNVYDLQVTASDGNGGTTVQNIAVTVTPINELPAISSPAAFNVAENSTAVGTVVAVDNDLPSQTLRYSISGGLDQGQFSINSTNGLLTFVAAPDFENPTDSGADNVYNVRVTVSDGHGGLVTQDIAVSVIAVNDNAPVFASPSVFNVAENSSAVGTVMATDADVPGQSLTYSITGGVDQSRFTISSGGVLSFITAPDSEHPTDSSLDNVYNLQVTANDGNGRSSVQNIAVTVTGLNDNAPVFTSAAILNVNENVLTVGSVTTNDADLPAQVISYAITGGADQFRFVITGGGALSFVAPPDFENPSDVDANNVYELQVTANDGNGKLTMQNILVTVSPVNDNAPVFTSPAAFNVAENSTSIGAISAIDADLPNQPLTYTITGGADQSRFTINNGALVFATAPNFENPVDAGANNTYEVQVTASDGRGGMTIQNIAVTVTPVNDHVPVFTSPATITVAENSIQVLNVLATDADLPTQAISYSIAGGVDQARFSITSGGLLTFLVPPDFEAPSDQGANNGYTLQVRASDGQGGSTLQNVAVIVTNVDEIAPTATIDPVVPNPRNSAVDAITIRFSEQVTGFDLSDMRLTRNGGANLLTGAELLTTADGVAYTLSGLSAFTAPDGGYRLTLIGASSGIVDVANIEYAEPGQDTSWTVDATAPSAVISIVSPDPRTTSVNLLTITFSETITGFGVNDLTLTRDGGSNLLTGFESLTSSDNVTFTLGGLGNITNGLGTYTLTVNAALLGVQDAVGNSLLSNATESWIRISPTVSLSINNGTLPEATGSATLTATLSTPTDVNVTVSLGFGGSSTFPADYSHTASQIVIPAGSMTGSIVLTAAPDGEFEPVEAILVDIINVTNAVEEATQQVTAQIVDDDYAPEFATTATPSIPENSLVVMTVVATDADLPAQAISYSITGGTDRDLFAITTGGELSFISSLNFEIPTDGDSNNTYQVQVTASDGHGGSTSQDMIVTITDIDEAPHLNLNGADVTWIKRQPPATILPQLTVTGLANLGGGTLTITTNVVGTPKKLLDLFTVPASNIGTTSGPQRSDGTLTLQIQLKQNATNAELQAFLRAVTFATKGKGLKAPTRNMQVTLADSSGASSTIAQTINVRRK